MAGREYDPSVKSTADALLEELEQRVETLADTLDYVKVLLRRLAAERALQTHLEQPAPRRAAEIASNVAPRDRVPDVAAGGTGAPVAIGAPVRVPPATTAGSPIPLKTSAKAR